MSKRERKKLLTPKEIREKAKKIVKSNPIYIKDEPSVVGSPDSLTEEIEENGESANRQRK